MFNWRCYLTKTGTKPPLFSLSTCNSEMYSNSITYIHEEGEKLNYFTDTLFLWLYADYFCRDQITCFDLHSRLSVSSSEPYVHTIWMKITYIISYANHHWSKKQRLKKASQALSNFFLMENANKHVSHFTFCFVNSHSSILPSAKEEVKKQLQPASKIAVTLKISVGRKWQMFQGLRGRADAVVGLWSSFSHLMTLLCLSKASFENNEVGN